jgi:ABC-type glycerol-3-phosphate transport system substrate-binding protein
MNKMENVSYNPLYLQVKEVILRRIVEGMYQPGELIPSEKELARDFKTSVSTVRQALSILVSEGYLIKKQGRGTFVSDQRVKVSFLNWMVESKRGFEIIRDLIALFERKHPYIDVVSVPVTYPECRGELMRLISAGNAPDVTQIVSHWTSYFASMGAFEPLESILSRENLSRRLADKDLFGGMYQGKIYSVAWGLCPVSLVANLNVLDEFGIVLEDTPLRLDRFYEICATISRESGGREMYCYGLPSTGDETDFLRIYPFLQAFRGGFVNDKEEVIFDSKENIDGFGWLRSFVLKNKIFISDIYTIRERFAAGSIAFISDGPWLKYQLEDMTGAPFNKNFRVALNPTYKDAKSYSWNYNHALAICSQSKNKLYAAKFIDDVTSDPEISNFYYSTVGHLPLNGSVSINPVYDDEFFRAYRTQLQNSRVLNAQNSMFEKAMVLCQDAVKKILFQEADIEKELSEKEYYLKMLYYG